MNVTTKSLSIDIGGTKIHAAIYDEHQDIQSSKKYKTGDFFVKKTPSELEDLLKQVATDFPADLYIHLGIAMNCAIKNKSIVYSSLLGGNVHINLEEVTRKYFSFERFSADNDVICMAKSEVMYGMGRDVTDFVFINLGTGIRAVWIENKKIVTGVNGLAGEISLLPLWVSELGEYIEADNLISGKGIELLSKKISGNAMQAEEIFSSKNNEVITVFVRHLADFLRTCSYMYNPSAFIFGGSLIKSADIWLPEVNTRYSEVTHPLFAAKTITISSVSDSASKGAILTS